MRDTRAELLMEAERLVRGRGYSGFSYGDLAEAVGIRKASIHHHFHTKEDLGVALIAAYDERYSSMFVAIEAEHEDALARIEAYGRLYQGGVEQGLGCLCAALAVELDNLPARLRADIVRFFEKHVAWLERVLSRGVAAGCIRANIETATTARMIVATLEGALMLERMLCGTQGFDSLLKAMLDGLRAEAFPEGARP